MIYQVPREQLFVCPKLQGLVLWRLLFYWSGCVTLTSLAVLGWSIFSEPAAENSQHVERLASYAAPALVVALLLLPLVIVDMISLSNRFLGPLIRLRASMRRLGTGERVMPLHFREADFWHEFAAEFDELTKCVERLETREPVEV